MSATCRCTTLKHANHGDRVCENVATEMDGYCKACHDHVAREFVMPKGEAPTAQDVPPRGRLAPTKH